MVEPIYTLEKPVGRVVSRYSDQVRAGSWSESRDSSGIRGVG